MLAFLLQVKGAKEVPLDFETLGVDLVTVGIVVGLIQMFKTFIPERIIPIAVLVAGIIITIIRYVAQGDINNAQDGATVLLAGVLVALAASGAYSQARTLAQPNNPTP